MVPKHTEINTTKTSRKMLLLTLKTARFLLIFLLVAATLSTSYSVQGGDYCAGEECSFLGAERKNAENKIGGGGEMVSDDYYYGKMDLMKERFEKSKYSRKSRMMMPKENYRARFVAFTADYKGPRRHPPKNN